MLLERETIIRVALALLNEVGLDGLTVRRLAERLGVQNPALYWHFKNKQEVLNGMAEVMLAEAYAGITLPPANEAWAEWLADVAGRMRHALLAYRDGARVVATAGLGRSEQLIVFDLALRVLTNAGFDLPTAFMSIVTIFDYTLGATIEEQLEPIHPITNPHDQTGPQRGSFDPVRLPMLTAALQAAPEMSAGRSKGFEAGVQLILAGMRAAKTPANS
jgi:TetR/AcrR family tetracycline transcriptional repressor